MKTVAENNKKVKPGYKAKAKKQNAKKNAPEKRFYNAPKKQTQGGEGSAKPAKRPVKQKKEVAAPGAANAREVTKAIQWFPGHMTRALREVEENIKHVDIVLELCDARVPLSSRNPKIAEIVKTKPFITIMNKSSLADPEKSAIWKQRMSEEGSQRVIFTDCMTGAGLDEIIPAIRAVLKDKLEAYEKKGMKRIPRAMILGVTNCGKSTLINRLYGSKKAKSENRPGVTRQSQWVTVEGQLELLDTPGVLWPKFDDEKVGLNLAFTGAIRDEILDIESISVLMLSKLLEMYPNLIFSRYKLSREDVTDKAPHEIFEAVAIKRGLLISGGEPDYPRTARMLLEEFRSGKIGRITLDW